MRRPATSAGGARGRSLIAYRFTGTGLQPVRIEPERREDLEAVDYLGQQVVEKHPVVTTWNVGSPLKVDLSAVRKEAGPYRPLREFGLASFYPVVEGYKESVSGGFRVQLRRPARAAHGHPHAGYSPDGDLPSSEKVHAEAEWNHYPWRMRAGHNPTDFYDLFGPTKTSRKGTYLGVGWEKGARGRAPEEPDAVAFGRRLLGLDRLPPTRTSRRPSTATSGSTAASPTGWSGTRSAGSSPSAAWPGDRLVERDRQERPHPARMGQSRPRPAALVLPLYALVPRLRRLLVGRPGPDLLELLLRRVRQQLVDHGSVRRYRDAESFPGVEINEIEGNNYGKLTVE